MSLLWGHAKPRAWKYGNTCSRGPWKAICPAAIWGKGEWTCAPFRSEGRAFCQIPPGKLDPPPGQLLRGKPGGDGGDNCANLPGVYLRVRWGKPVTKPDPETLNPKKAKAQCKDFIWTGENLSGEVRLGGLKKTADPLGITHHPPLENGAFFGSCPKPHKCGEVIHPAVVTRISSKVEYVSGVGCSSDTASRGRRGTANPQTPTEQKASHKAK